MLEKYQNNIHDIIDKLDLKNKFINIDGYDTVSLDILKNWYIKDVITSTGKLKKCLIGRSDYLWNEEVENQIIDIRKKCIDKFGLDIILLDLDVCGILDLHDNEHSIEISNKVINHFKHVSKKCNLKLKYLIRGVNNNDVILIIFENLPQKFNKKQINQIKYLHKWCYKKGLYFICNNICI